MSVMQRPIYFRLLRVKHIRPGWLLTLALFEGSCFLGALLAFADIVSVWGVVLLPVAVAVLVKFNDVVAGALIRPLAEAQLNTPRPRDHAAIGRSPVPRPSRLTALFSADDAQFDPEAGPGGDVARGVATVPGFERSGGRRPRPGVPQVSEHPGDQPAQTMEWDQPVRPDGADGRSRGNQGRFLDDLG